ncbi:MAG: hypothetical protein AAGD22_03490, partial [Verrucomicrobiota bacterium]
MNIISKYFTVQKSKGNFFGKALTLLPRKIMNQIAYRRMRGDENSKPSVIVGFSRFDLPLLASYSRSGTNW